MRVRYGNITDEEYLSAINTTKLDSSEFILLTLSLLERKLTTAAENKERLNKVLLFYLENDYPSAIERLITLCNDNANTLQPKELVEKIKQKSAQLEDDPTRNDSRRYFETKFSESLTKEIVDNSRIFYKSIDKLAHIIIEFGIESKISATPPQTVEKYEDAAEVIGGGYIAAFNDIPTATTLKEQSLNSYKKKDRREISYRDAGENLNPGILRSLSPNYPDQLLTRDEMRKRYNAAFGKYRMGDAKTAYSAEHRDVPYVGSVSGSAFGLVVVLQKFMEANKESSELQNDINNIMKVFFADFIKRGFHSLQEMVAVFKEPHIQQIFADYNVKLDLTFPENVLRHAQIEAQQYTKTLVLKRVTQEQLIQGDHLLKKSTSEVQEEVLDLNGTKIHLIPHKSLESAFIINTEGTREPFIPYCVEQCRKGNTRILQLLNEKNKLEMSVVLINTWRKEAISLFSQGQSHNAAEQEKWLKSLATMLDNTEIRKLVTSNTEVGIEPILDLALALPQEKRQDLLKNIFGIDQNHIQNGAELAKYIILFPSSEWKAIFKTIGQDKIKEIIIDANDLGDFCRVLLARTKEERQNHLTSLFDSQEAAFLKTRIKDGELLSSALRVIPMNQRFNFIREVIGENELSKIIKNNNQLIAVLRELPSNQRLALLTALSGDLKTIMQNYKHLAAVIEQLPRGELQESQPRTWGSWLRSYLPSSQDGTAKHRAIFLKQFVQTLNREQDEVFKYLNYDLQNDAIHNVLLQLERDAKKDATKDATNQPQK